VKAGQLVVFAFVSRRLESRRWRGTLFFGSKVKSREMKHDNPEFFPARYNSWRAAIRLRLRRPCARVEPPPCYTHCPITHLLTSTTRGSYHQHPISERCLIALLTVRFTNVLKLQVHALISIISARPLHSSTSQDTPFIAVSSLNQMSISQLSEM
jgi:hypothetical protein